MLNRTDMKEGLRMSQGHRGSHLTARQSWERYWELETAGDVEPTRVSLASRLEASRSVAGRVAQWLFIKGGMAILLISGLMLLGLVGGLLHTR
jgi:hypothetical protein